MIKISKTKTLGQPTRAGAFISYLLLGFWALVVLFPIYWLITASFKEMFQVNNGPFFIPWVDFAPSLENWRYIFVDIWRDTYRPFINTVIIALTSSALALLIGGSAAYGLTRFEYRPRVAGVWLFIVLLVLSILAVVVVGIPWPLVLAIAAALFFLLLQPIIKRTNRSLGNNDIAFWLISQRMLPPVASIIPIYLLFQNLRMLDTHAALIITYIATNLPIVVWLMRDYFLNIPKELEESARVDGASPYRVLWSIVLPLSTPGLVATFLFVLVFAWNEYLVALFLSLAKTQTMPLLVAGQNGTRGPQWGYMSVLICIMIIPVIAMAIALERYISRGLLVGAVKG
jgi:multiple sugar transport system permease protein